MRREFYFVPSETGLPDKRTAGPAGPLAPTALSSGGNSAMMRHTFASVQMKTHREAITNALPQICCA
jgi:hypothetical protein